jgi:membrane protein required for colicin V production
MHILDIVFLAAAVALTGIGIWRGLIAEAFRLIAVVLGILAAAMLYRPLSGQLGFLDVSTNIKVIIAFVAVFVPVLGAVLAAGWAVKKVVHLTMLGWVDRACGGCLGFLKCFLVAWIVSLILAALPIPELHKRLERSVTYSVCRALPMRLRVPKVADMKESIEEAVSDTPGSLLPRKFVEFRDRVDSVKNSQTRGTVSE